MERSIEADKHIETKRYGDCRKERENLENKSQREEGTKNQRSQKKKTGFVER